MRFRQLLLVVFTLALVAAPAASGVAAAAETTPTTATVDTTVTLDNDERPGRILATARFAGASGSFTVSFAGMGLNTTVTGTTGFERVDEGVYRYDGSTPNPSIAYEIRLVNHSVVAQKLGDPMAVDPGVWAMVGTYRAVPDVSGQHGLPTVTTAGPGYSTDQWTFIGPVETYTRTAGGEEIRLVVPEAGAPVSQPETILDQLATTSEELPIGGHSDRVTILSLPSAGITTPWGGVATGSNAIVRDEFAVAADSSVWVHEYVHTRQRFGTTSRMKWLVEASANYYSSHETFSQQRLSYSGFRSAITVDAFGGAVLAERDTWQSPLVPYVKGERALGYLDGRIREATDHERTLADVFDRINRRQTLTAGTFYRTIAAVSTPAVADDFEQYVETNALAPGPDSPHSHTMGGSHDPDGDGLSNARERASGTHPFRVDTDGDGLSDGREAQELDTSPTEADTDGDGRSDAAELTAPRTNPTVADTDADGLSDGRELELALDPTTADSDGDGLSDGAELEAGTSPRYEDTDSDGLSDGREVELGTDPLRADTDGDGLGDSLERDAGLDPTTTDTDGDSYGDRAERLLGTDPTTKTSLLTYLQAYLNRLLGGLFG
ncbi:hypothetical protein [Natronomonas sp. EA1]|uniref:hypothetical protein n=1 Tax=Natronomonas sp. EA1 TaxID=3421655 RepID=UPI003EBFA3E8